MLQPPADVGIYAIAYKFIEQSFLIPGLLMSAIFPILVKRMHESREQSEELIRKAFVFLLLVGIPLAMAIFIMAERLVGLVASEDFAPAAEPLRVVSLVLPVIFASMIFFNVLIVLNRQRTLILVSLLSLVLNLALNLYFIPRYSYMGAAWTTVATETVAFLGLFLMTRKAYSLTLDYRARGATGAVDGVRDSDSGRDRATASPGEHCCRTGGLLSYCCDHPGRHARRVEAHSRPLTSVNSRYAGPPRRPQRDRSTAQFQPTPPHRLSGKTSREATSASTHTRTMREVERVEELSRGLVHDIEREHRLVPQTTDRPHI